MEWMQVRILLRRGRNEVDGVGERGDQGIVVRGDMIEDCCPNVDGRGEDAESSNCE